MVNLVLVGGGHAHVQVMVALAAAARPDLSVTLISPDRLTPYSGMLPGYIAGLYSHAEIHIDLDHLARKTGIRRLEAAATALDRAGRRVLVDHGEPVPYDLISFDVGIRPDLSGIAGAETHAVAVKPISRFIDRLEATRAALTARATAPRIAIVGGGAAGVELAFAIRARLVADRATAGHPAPVVTLVTSGELIPTLNSGMRRRARAALQAAGITVSTDARVAAIDPEGLVLTDGRRLAADAVFVSTRARAPELTASLGVSLDAQGALRVAPTLQSVDDPTVFAAGDCAALSPPVEKAGVFAVRQGPVLAHNLLAAATGRPLTPYEPQRQFLVLLSTADGRAIGGRGPWLAFSGRAAMWLKDRIDRAFMARFR